MKKISLALSLCAILGANSLEQIKKDGVLRVAVFKDAAPFQLKLDNEQYEGFEIDLINRVAKDLFGTNGGKVEFIGVNDNKERETLLQENRVDITIANFSITDQRKQSVDFSMPYFSVNFGVLSNKNDNIKNIKDANKILLKKGSTAHEYFSKIPNLQIAECLSESECYKILKSNPGYAWGHDNIILLGYPILDSDVELGVKTIGPTDFIGAAVAKNNKELLNFVNEEFVKLSKNGYFKEMFENNINPFYKGTANPKYFLLDSVYSSLF